MKEIIDLRYFEWTKKRESSGTAGSYLKSMSYSNGKKVYYKLSFYDEQNHLFGYESVNEYITSQERFVFTKRFIKKQVISF